MSDSSSPLCNLCGSVCPMRGDAKCMLVEHWKDRTPGSEEVLVVFHQLKRIEAMMEQAECQQLAEMREEKWTEFKAHADSWVV